MSGMDVLTIGEILGHRDLRMTQPYAHIAPAHKLAAVSLLGASFREPENGTKTAVSPDAALVGSKNGSSHEKQRYSNVAKLLKRKWNR